MVLRDCRVTGEASCEAILQLIKIVVVIVDKMRGVGKYGREVGGLIMVVVAHKHTSKQANKHTSTQAHKHTRFMRLRTRSNFAGGDKVCDPEENALWSPSGLATQTIKDSSCSADCGFVPAYPVSIDFSDVTKLRDSYRAMEHIEKIGFGGYPTNRWLRKKVASGWNVCHQSHRQVGGFTPICVFEGDLLVQGLPFRSAELTPNTPLFGTKVAMALYPGEWELRSLRPHSRNTLARGWTF